MEDDPNNMAVVLQIPAPTTWKSTTPNPKEKKHRNVNPMRVALFLFCRHACANNKDPLHAQVVKPGGGRGLWKTLLAAMHLLHHHHHHAPQLLEPTKAAAPASTALVRGDASEPFVSAPPSPTLTSDDDDSRSRYASANDLRELDTGASNDDDHTIDARAEEFIAKFYEQIRLQRLQSTNGD